jgi:hypothetical protein
MTVTFIDLEDVVTETVKTYAIIANEDGSTTSMLKAHYDELQKQADQPIGGNK